MPELPEVETVKEGLRHILKIDGGKKPLLVSVKLRRKNLRTIITPTLAKLKQLEISDISRRAKFILWHTPQGVILNHLGMTGSWRELNPDAELQKHDHVIFEFSNGLKLAYQDPRRFGILEYFSSQDKIEWLHHLGPEPLKSNKSIGGGDAKLEFSDDYLFAKTRKRKVPIKNLIMDQKVVVGVGNIYASEALYLAGVRPTRLAERVTKAECESLVSSIQSVLTRAIKAGGTTIRDFRQAGGEQGYFALELKVYGRSGHLCRKCHSPIKSKVIAGRSTFWCSQCQK